MSEYGFIESNGVFVDELDVRMAFDELENELNVLEFPVSDYLFEFTLNRVLKGRKFSHLSDLEKKVVFEYIVDNY